MKSIEPTVFIVDDEEAVRDSLGALIASAGLRARAFASGCEFLEHYRAELPGCLLLDIRMSGVSGMELHDEILKRGLTLPVIFITGHGDIALAVSAVKKGAIDFVEKPFSDDKILSLVASAIALDAKQREDSNRRAATGARLASVTPREREVLDRVLEGKTNRVIAEELFVTVKTVEFHRARIMQKLGAGSLAELVRLCLQ